MRSNILSTVARLTSTTSLTRPALLAVIAAGAVLAPHSAFALEDGALPTGENVVGGSASFDRSTANVLNIHQSTDRTVINWDSFNIGASATTEFFQPNSGSLAVNRVTSKGSDPTQILGTLKANGRVMVLDRNGVLFGQNSVVDAGGIVASTGDVDDKAVMRGDKYLVLTNLGSGQIINKGTINIHDGGLAAFVAPTVRNDGVINAKLGKVALAAGSESATVDLYGDGLVELAMSNSSTKILAENKGTINAEAGTVALTASAAKDVVDTVVNMSGVINASSATMVGGKIILSGGQSGKVKLSGKANASGRNGGKVTVTGKNVELAKGSVITANGLDNGNGGNVYIYGDKSVIFRGRVSAEAGANGGNGGNVEVSTGKDLTFAGNVSTKAKNGVSGSLVIDPSTLTIHSGSLDDVNYLSALTLSNQLSSNGTVTVQATDSVNVGTTTSGLNIGTNDINVSQDGAAQTTLGDLNLKASIVNFVKNLTVGNGSVSVDAATLNLNSKVYGKDAGSTVLLGDDRLNSTAALTEINIESPDAKIQQGISFANDGARINVAAGTYDEAVKVNKSVGLYGSHAVIAHHSTGFDVTAGDVVIDGFKILASGKGIQVKNADHVTLNNNIIENAQYGILADNVGHLVVSRNKIDGQVASETYGVAGIYVKDSDGAIVGGLETGNRVEDYATGIRVISSDSAVVDGNEVSKFTANGIRASESNSIEIDHNKVHNGSGTGISVYQGNESRISNNIVFANGKNGIEHTDGNDSVIFGNNINDNKNRGIYIDNSNGTEVYDNEITKSGWDGIHHDDGYGASIHDNTISSSGDDGVDVNNSSSVDVSNNTITGTGGNGVEVSGGDTITVLGNTISKTKLNGIYVDYSYNTTLDTNTITNTGYSGIHTFYSYTTDIVNNIVNGAKENGVFVYGGNDVLVDHNEVSDSGNDGIEVDYIYGRNDEGSRLLAVTADDTIPVEESTYYNVRITDNTVTNSGNNGIEAYDVERLLIARNAISNSGLSGSDIESSYYDQGNDGIHVVSYGRNYYWGSDVLVDIIGNTVEHSTDDGVEVTYINGRGYSEGRLFAEAVIGEGVSSIANINIIGNNVNDSGDNGILVSLSDGFKMYEPTFGYKLLADVPTYGETDISVLIDSNTVNNPLDIVAPPSEEAGLINEKTVIQGRGDGIEVSSFFSPWSNVVTDTTVSNNTVSNSGVNGVYISGPNHDFVTMLANELIDNPVGARFESGQIDLTGAANTITGGDIGLQFSPEIIGYNIDMGDGEVQLLADVVSTPVYAPMSLVDDTIGTTVFNNQGTYFVELSNGAFFDPGLPTLLNGLNATYNGFSPSSTGGAVTAAQFNSLESKIFHFTDDNTLGLFLFGAVPSATFSQEDIYRIFGVFDPKTPSGSLTITGLPRIGGAAPTGGAGGTAASFLANISPAAGDEEGSNGAPQNVGTIEPAAGGEPSDAACWQDATGILGQGTPVSYSFGDEGSKLLDKAAACGGKSS